jgi:hypothetical protein
MCQLYIYFIIYNLTIHTATMKYGPIDFEEYKLILFYLYSLSLSLILKKTLKIGVKNTCVRGQAVTTLLKD